MSLSVSGSRGISMRWTVRNLNWTDGKYRQILPTLLCRLHFSNFGSGNFTNLLYRSVFNILFKNQLTWSLGGGWVGGWGVVVVWRSTEWLHESVAVWRPSHGRGSLFAGYCRDETVLEDEFGPSFLRNFTIAPQNSPIVHFGTFPLPFGYGSSTVLGNSNPGEFSYVWQSEWVGIIVKKIERTRIHFY